MPELKTQIADLCSADGATRQRAAEALYEQGKSVGTAAIQSWIREPEIAALIAGPVTVGIAVTPATFEVVRKAMGVPRLADVPKDQDAAEFEVHFGAAHLDILTTQGPPGAIARFLEKFGEGIQQVEFPVTDVGRATELIGKRFGVKAIYAETRAGADRTRVNFFLATTPEGRKVLVELVEATAR